MSKLLIWHNVNSSCCKQCFASNSCRPKQYISNDVHDISVITFTTSLQQSLILLYHYWVQTMQKPKCINIFRTKLHILKLLFRTHYVDTLPKLKHRQRQ